VSDPSQCFGEVNKCTGLCRLVEKENWRPKLRATCFFFFFFFSFFYVVAMEVSVMLFHAGC